jgi:hypothetical protein
MEKLSAQNFPSQLSNAVFFGQEESGPSWSNLSFFFLLPSFCSFVQLQASCCTVRDDNARDGILEV